jgi:hypothetical protein
MPCRPLPDTSFTLDSVQSLKSSLLPKVHGDSLQTNALLVWIFPSDLLPSCACVYRVSRPTVCLFPQCISCQIRRECYRYSQRSSVKHVFGLVLTSEYLTVCLLIIVPVRYTFEPPTHTSYIRHKYKTEWLHLLLQKDISLGFVDNRINPLNMKRKLFYLKTQFVPRSKHFLSRL